MVEHVPDCERLFGGPGLRLRLARGSSSHRQRADWLRGLAGVFGSLGVCRW